MNAKELIGKTCIREKPVIKERWENTRTIGLFYGGGGYEKIQETDYTYCAEAVKIVAASDHNIVVERISTFSGKPIQTILDERYCDDHWVDFDELLTPAEQGGGGKE